MLALIRPFLAIVLLREPPQSLPPSPFLLAVVLVAQLVLGWILAGMLHYGLARGLAVSVVSTGLLVGLGGGAVYLRGYPERMLQTVTALAGTGALLDAIALPLGLWAIPPGVEAGEAGGAGGALLARLLYLALLAWSWLVQAHVFRHALSVPFGVGLAVTIGLFWISANVVWGLFPETAAAAHALPLPVPSGGRFPPDPGG